MEVGRAEAILKWRQCWTNLSAEKPRLITNYHLFSNQVLELGSEVFCHLVLYQMKMAHY